MTASHSQMLAASHHALPVHAFAHVSISVPSLLFVTTAMIATGVWTMLVYRSSATRLDDELLQPIADLYAASPPAEVETHEDEDMMFGEGIASVHYFREPGYA
ncbi:hypothetical protein [Nocardia terpenica]|uniref:hypothetical protein n=1 Tax=Nocardia terpenica TaxID=455432 RepID=UPI0012E88E86|nr:hypothetical protein [Nocardia terpenica]NQE88096.1 hypothetical protein [Nocardia terpenica]